VKRVLATAVLLVVAQGASAEVRLVQQSGSPALRITASPQGIWSPTGEIDALVLNPSGDALGDGAPAAIVGTGAVTAAWVRQAASEVRVAVGTTTWQHERVLAAPDAVGTPMGVDVDAGLVLCWSRSDGDASCAFAVANGSTVVAQLAAAVPRSVVGLGDEVHVFVISPQPFPEPIIGLYDIVLRPVQGSSPRLDVVDTIELGSVHSMLSPVDATACESGETLVVTWEAAPARMGWAAIDAQGVTDGPAVVRVPGNSAHAVRRRLERDACR
jgi:hypothetical protein